MILGDWFIRRRIHHKKQIGSRWTTVLSDSAVIDRLNKNQIEMLNIACPRESTMQEYMNRPRN